MAEKRKRGEYSERKKMKTERRTFEEMQFKRSMEGERRQRQKEWKMTMHTLTVYAT